MSFSAGESIGAIHATLELDRDEFQRGLDAAKAKVTEFEASRRQIVIDITVSGAGSSSSGDHRADTNTDRRDDLNGGRVTGRDRRGREDE